MVKRKRLSTETEPEKPVEVRTTHIEDMALVDERAESHYSRPHWAQATAETPVNIGDVQEPVVALVDHSSEIDLMSMHFCVQKTSSHLVILGEPYITAARMKTKVLDNGSAYARVKSQDGRHSVQFLTAKTERIFREGCQGVGAR